ncbi:MAG: COQ9 family protein [Alphaproteobacteria bacterium]
MISTILAASLLEESAFSSCWQKACRETARLHHLNDGQSQPLLLAKAIPAAFMAAVEEAFRQHEQDVGGIVGVTAKVRVGIICWLQQLSPHRVGLKNWAAYLAFYPHHYMAAFWQMADSVWKLAGDQSQDSNYYSKRSLLAGVMASSFLVWLDDQSPNYEKTLAFTDRRLSEILRVGKNIGSLKNILAIAGDGLIAGLTRCRYPHKQSSSSYFQENK